MRKVDFDDYQENYNELLRNGTRFFDKDDGYFAEYKVNLVRKHLPNKPGKILEYGCGIGRNLGVLRRHFPEAAIYGCDISGKSLETAAKALPDAKLFTIGQDAVEEHFDLVFMANVIHHVPPGLRPTVFKDISGMLEEDGALFIFEHNPYNPATRYLVNTCPFDQDAVLVKPAEMKKLITEAGLQNVTTHYTLFFPAFLRGLRPLEALLVRVPLGGQYMAYAQQRV